MHWSSTYEHLWSVHNWLTLCYMTLGTQKYKTQPGPLRKPLCSEKPDTSLAVEAQMRKGSSYGICLRVHHLHPSPGFLNKNSINIWLLPTHSLNCYQKGLQQYWSLATFWLKAFQWLPVVFRLRFEPLGRNLISSWQPLPSSSAPCSQDWHFSSAKPG